MDEGSRTLRVATVQVVSENGRIQGNLENATRFLEAAASQGARLILLPEFLATGYIFNKSIWDAGEPHEGPTVTWLKETSKRLGVWLGASFLEAEDADFFNTFVLANPAGAEDGRVRKQTPAFAEAYFTKGDAGSHVIQCEFGKIGVGICYENMLAYTPQLMHSQAVDLALMPHSMPSPTPSVLFPRRLLERYNDGLRGLGPYYSELLGVPVIVCNKSGPWRSPVPFLPWLKQDSTFPGLSAIADSDGSLLGQLGPEEGFVIADVVLDPARKTGAIPPCRGRWAREVPWAIKQFRLVEVMGAAWYRMSGDRKRRARQISAS